VISRFITRQDPSEVRSQEQATPFSDYRTRALIEGYFAAQSRGVVTDVPDDNTHSYFNHGGGTERVEPLPIAWTSGDGNERHGRCTCDVFRLDGSCEHIWYLALVYAGVNRLDLSPKPTIFIDFEGSCGQSDGWDKEVGYVDR
jgi:hypothetical protein